MGIRYSTAAGFGIMFTGDEIEQFVKDHNIESYDDYCWDCAEAVSSTYSLDFGYAGNDGDETFLFGSVTELNSYDDNQFKFNEIRLPSMDDAAALDKLSKDSGKKPAFYAGMHVG